LRSARRLEGLNSKIRLLSHRAYGFAPADALIATIYLCCSGIQIDLPHRRFTAKRAAKTPKGTSIKLWMRPRACIALSCDKGIASQVAETLSPCASGQHRHESDEI
jgi:hypothetical protein